MRDNPQPQPHLACTYWQFRERLTEWVDWELVLRYQAEIFVQYALGRTVEQAADFIIALEAE